ncbi:MAG: ribosomal L7Ae/L30e/S12e/Gadd45 family protein [Nanoarchaeota archaeon]
MAGKKDTATDVLKELKARVQEKKVIIGTEQVLKQLRAKKVHKIYLASNCPVQVKDDIMRYALLAGVPVTELPQTNEELGVFCKKNFFISVLGIPGE